MKKYIIEDQLHCETIGEFSKPSDAIDEFRRLSNLAWNEDKNLAPCMSYETCCREYELIEYEVNWNEWIELHREAIFDIGSSGIIFHKNSYFLN